MIYQKDSNRNPSSKSSFEDNLSPSETMIVKPTISLPLHRDDTSETEQNGSGFCAPQQGSPHGSDSSFLAKLAQPSQIDEDIETGTKSPMLVQDDFSHSLNNLVATHVPNDFELNGWTVRNSEGYQQELLKHSLESGDMAESDIGLGTAADVSTNNDLYHGSESSDDSILVHLLLSFPEPVHGEVWNNIHSSLKVSQSVTEQKLTLPISRTSFVCYQQSEVIPASDVRLAREISACITFKRCLHDTATRYQFQLFLAIAEKQNESIQIECYWNKLNVVAFIQFPSTGQLLLPIEREVSRDEALAATEGMFLGSFFMHNRKLYHHVPSETSLRQREKSHNNYSIAHIMNSEREEVVIVDRKDIVLEPNGARGGRPSHRDTGQLLMTRPQVEKVLEIRNRWEGLSPRQRRDNVTNADFYTFLTLNRDETAEYLGVCATWLKDAIRSQGVNVWPGRPLRRTGAMLQTLKESLESTRAALRFSDPLIGKTKRYEADIHRYENEIRDLLAMRVEIVKANVSREYFDRFIQEHGKQYLDPDWNALPPRIVHKYNT